VTHLAHHNCNDLLLNQEGAPDTHTHTHKTVKLWPPNSTDLNPVDYKIWGVMQQCVYQKPVRNVDELKQRLIEAWTGIQQSVIDQAIDQWRDCLNMCVSKLMAIILNICCGVFVHNCKFVMTFNACVTKVMNRLTNVVSQGSVMTFIRRGEQFCHCFIAN